MWCSRRHESSPSSAPCPCASTMAGTRFSSTCQTSPGAHMVRLSEFCLLRCMLVLMHRLLCAAHSSPCRPHRPRLRIQLDSYSDEAGTAATQTHSNVANANSPKTWLRVQAPTTLRRCVCSCMPTAASAASISPTSCTPKRSSLRNSSSFCRCRRATERAVASRVRLHACWVCAAALRHKSVVAMAC